MKWGFRWYGEKGDSIPLNHVRQIPGINGVVGTLLNKMPGDVWEVSEIRALKESIEKEELELLGIESVAIHDAIKQEPLNAIITSITIFKQLEIFLNVAFI